MEIGLYNLEPQIVNTALMQVSKYHKDKGDQVELYSPLKKYDKVYAFSIFKFTDKGYVKKDMICGGSGFDIKTKLPKEIEDCDYDWSLYPKCDFSIIWFSRGCIRNCPFCLVKDKEGFIHSVKPKNLNPNGKYIKVTDNNFFANPKWKEAIKQLKKWDQLIEFQCGIDLRLLTKDHCKVLQKLKIKKMLHTAWDNPKENLINKFKLLIKYIKPYRIMSYVLIGYWSTPEQDLFRVMELKKLGVKPFVMPYNKKDKYQKAFARYVNRKEIFMSTSWEDYKRNPNKPLPKHQEVLNFAQ